MNEEPSAAVLQAIEAALSLRSATSRGAEVTFLCPVHPDRHPSADFNRLKFTWVCRACGAGGGWIDLARRLDVDPFPKAAKAVMPKGITRYPVYDHDGVLVAEKVREDDGDGHKTMRWEPSGINPADYLYGTESIVPGNVYLVEGERAAKALIDLGQAAVGTVSGAGKVPSGRAFAPLVGHSLVIWGDNDEVGQNAAREIALAANSVGISPIYLVVWRNAPDKGDAADWVANGADWSELVQTRWRPPEPQYRTAVELMAMNFPPMQYAIPGVLAEGLNILAGPPKIGKSWFVLQAALAIAYGGRAFGVKVEQGDVLYYALEDGWRRLKRRLREVLHGQPAPEGLTLGTWIKRLDDGGLDSIEDWVSSHQQARLVIVDTFQRARPLRGGKGADTYGEDVIHSAELQRLAVDYGVAILAIHHTRKATGDDPLEAVSGTQGLAGTADAVLVLRRERNQPTGQLFITGRDVREQTLAMTFDDFHKWNFANPELLTPKETTWTQPHLVAI